MIRRLSLFCLLVILFNLFVAAQESGQGLQDSIEDVNERVENTQEYLDEEKWDNIGEQWQAYLVQNKFIQPFDEAFRSLNFVFVILFARDYSLSLTLFFAFLLWLFTMLWVYQFSSAFVKREVVPPLIPSIIGILAASAIAHTQIFNIISRSMFKVMFYKSSPLWSFVIFIILMVLLFVYLYLGRIFGTYIKQVRRASKQKKLEHEVEIERTRRIAEERARK